MALASLEAQRDMLTPQQYAEELEELADEERAGRLTNKVGIMRQMGDFDHVNIWAHESTPNNSEDKITRSVNEGIKVANAIGRL